MTTKVHNFLSQQKKAVSAYLIQKSKRDLTPEEKLEIDESKTKLITIISNGTIEKYYEPTSNQYVINTITSQDKSLHELILEQSLFNQKDLLPGLSIKKNKKVHIHTNYSQIFNTYGQLIQTIDMKIIGESKSGTIKTYTPGKFFPSTQEITDESFK